MKLLWQELKPHWKVLIIIIIIHIVRAYTTLLLPTYTSGLVDTGIQNKGFEYAVPLALTQEDAQQLQTFMLPEEIDRVDDYYEQQNGNYILSESVQDDESLEQLQETFAVPMAIYQSVANLSEEERNQVINQLTQQGIDASNTEQAEEARATVVPELQAYGDQYIHTSGVQAALAMYEASGEDTDSVQVNYLMTNGAQMIGIAIVTVLTSVLGFYFSSRVGADIGSDMRSKIFSKVLHFSDHEIEQYSTASLITRSTNDIQQVQLVLTVVLRGMMFAPILAIGGLIYIITMQPSMAWILAFSIALIAIVVLILFSLTLPRFKIIQKLFDRVNLIAREILTGLQVIRAFGRQKFESKRFDEANTTLQDTHLFTGRTMSLMMPFMIFILDATSILVVWVASHRIADGVMQVGDMMAFIAYSMQVLMSFLMVSSMSLMLPRSIISLNRIQEVLETSSSINDPEEPKKLEHPKGEVTFKDVSFMYDDADTPTVDNISFTARPGETTAIIGSTGSGKSTLLNLLMRFFDVTEGSITIDGVDIRDITQEDLHDLIGYVPQQGILFSGTIKSNIGYGVDNISDETIKKAAEIAHATDFIEGKDARYDAVISQGGSNVSGGQKQRLSIARAIAKNPSIYLFDDSFSALDYRTDASLRRALSKNVSDATVIIVAQRISTILDAEQIIVLDDGEIDGIGNHVELMHSSPVYREIAESQLSKSELEAQEEKQLANQNKHLSDLKPGWEG